MTKVIVNGTFDILHRGHLEMLHYAKSQGDYLLVCIDSDERVQELKGPTRPVNSQKDRMFMLNSLKCVDYVKVFNTKEELEQSYQKYTCADMSKFNATVAEWSNATDCKSVRPGVQIPPVAPERSECLRIV